MPASVVVSCSVCSAHWVFIWGALVIALTPSVMGTVGPADSKPWAMNIKARIKICTKKQIIILLSYSHHSKKKPITYDYNMFAYRPGLCYCCEPQGLYDDVITAVTINTHLWRVFFCLFKPEFSWTSINCFHGFPRALTEKVPSSLNEGRIISNDDSFLKLFY